MAVNDSEKIDLLIKKLIYSVSKTQNASDLAPYEEGVASPLWCAGNEIWINAKEIPAIPPTENNENIKLETVNLTRDESATGIRSWLAIDGTGTRFQNWIPSSFGPQYSVKLYKGDPSSGGTLLFQSLVDYLFDYRSGVLSFIGQNAPSFTGITESSTDLFLVGYRYIGPTDISDYLSGGGGGGSGGGGLGNEIELGSPTDTDLTDGRLAKPPAITLTEQTTVTDAIDSLNETIGLLLPTAPPVFPGDQSLTFSSVGNTPFLCAGVTDYSDEPTGSANKVLPGDAVVRVITGTNVLSNTITSCGPGDAGTLTATLNKTTADEAAIGTPVVLDSQDNSTDPNDNSIELIITNNTWYPIETPGFWQSFDSSLSINYNNILPGIHKATIEHTSGTELHGFFVFDDFISNPNIDASEMTISDVNRNTVYSSGVGHFGQGAKVILSGIKLSNIVGKTYYGGDFITVSISNSLDMGSDVTPLAGGPISYNHTDFGKPPELSETDWQSPEELSNGVDILLNNTDSIKVFRLQMSVTNVNATESIQLSPTFLYANGNPVDAIVEDAIPVVGFSGATNAERIKFPASVGSATDQPINAYTPTDSDFFWNGGTSFANLLYATVVGGQISHDTTNYQSYYPAGPNYSGSDRQTNVQYITFRFTGAGISNFDIDIKGQIRKCFVKLEGITDQYSSTKWWSMNTAAESGIPGDIPGLPDVSGSLGCASSNTVMPSGSTIDGRFNCTFGLANSTNAANNGILIRFVLDSGDYIKKLRFVNPSST